MEIKFRAWDTEKMLYYGFVVHRGEMALNEYGDMIGIRDSVLMQYAGRADEMGQDIYVGDVAISYKSPTLGARTEIKHVVKFGHYVTPTNVFYSGNEMDNYTEPQQHYGFYLEEIGTGKTLEIGGYVLKIIGNIYETPELLEV